ncbi:MAG TPA: hypothetical protein VIZ64_11875 [Dokdonella sp.]
MHDHFRFRSRYSPRRAAVMLAVAAGIAVAASDAGAATFKVGTSAGEPGSDCQFRTPQQAIDALPADDELHVVELESGPYANADAAVEIDGRRVRLVTRHERSSGCRAPATLRAQLVAQATSLHASRTVFVHGEGELVLEHVDVRGNPNGALFIRDAHVTLVASSIEGNRSPAGASGAGIVLEGGTLALEDARIAGNIAGANGGAIFCTPGATLDASVRIAGDSRIEANRANHGGGAYLFRGCTLDVAASTTFALNVAALDGGAIGTEPVGPSGVSNTVLLRGSPAFAGNLAGGRGGAIEVDQGNTLATEPDSLPLFDANQASGAGGALSLRGDDTHADMGAARFVANRSDARGGAIAVADGARARLAADCARGDTVDDAHCAAFERNEVASDPFEARAGGALHVDGGELSVDGYAFRDSRGPATSNSESGGIVAAVDAGLLRVSNALVFDTAVGLGGDTHLFQVNGGVAQLLFDTIVDTPDGTVVFVQPNGTAELVGTIIAGNHAGIVSTGTLRGTCNNAQLGTDPAPRDPGFVTTPAGRYRLGPGSLMIDRALTCDPDDLPAGFEPPGFDLDGRARVEPGEPPMALDLGAFEFRADAERVFGDGFDPSMPR